MSMQEFMQLSQNIDLAINRVDVLVFNRVTVLDKVENK